MSRVYNLDDPENLIEAKKKLHKHRKSLLRKEEGSSNYKKAEVSFAKAQLKVENIEWDIANKSRNNSVRL